MKAWMNKLGGILLASLLTVMLNGKAYAEEKPEGAGIEASTPAAADSGSDNAVVSSGDAGTGSVVVDMGSGAAGEGSGNFDAGFGIANEDSGDTGAGSGIVDMGSGNLDAGLDNSGADSDDAGMGLGVAGEGFCDADAGSGETGAGLGNAGMGAGGVDTGSVDADPDDPAADGTLTDGIELLLTQADVPEDPKNPVSPSDDAANAPLETLTLTVEPKQLSKGFQENASAPMEFTNLFSAPADAMITVTAVDEDDKEQPGEPAEKKNDTPVLLGTAAKSAELQPKEKGKYILVNNQSGGNITADDSITILAAGLNHIGSVSIPDDGTVTIAGTGILLVDSLKGNTELLTFTDIYSEGSVAVFVKQDNDQYLLINGCVPGILDEEYTITEDVTLVMPDQTKLLICGTGAATLRDSEGNKTTAYYHGSDANYSPLNSVSSMDAIETTGKLTIAQQAALIVKQGASIVLQNLTSLGGTETFDGIRYPEFIVNNGGKLIVDEGGSVNGGGFVEIGPEEATLSGKGSITASRITVKDTKAIYGSEVRLSSREIRLQTNSSEETTLENLKIQDSTVFIDIAKPHITGLDSTGNSTLVLPDASTLDISNVNGTLHLSQMKHYNQNHGFTRPNETFYSDDNAQTITGSITGTGTIYFDSGIYKIVAGTTVTGIRFSSDSENSEEYGGLVYDYAGVTAASQNPRHIRPADVERADKKQENQGKVWIPVIADEVHESNSSVGEKTITVHDLVIRVQDAESGEIQEVPFPVERLVVEKDEENWTLSLEAIKNAVDNMGQGVGVVIEVLHKEIDGDTVNLGTDFYTPSTLPNTLEHAEDICLVRVSYVHNRETVAPAESETRLGITHTGSGILGGSNAGSVTIGPGITGNNTNTNADTTAPKLTLLMANVNGAQEQTTLVWVELAPVVDAKATSPEETVYILVALEGEKTLKEMGGKATVSMSYAPPAEYAGKPLYIVFRNKDNSLTAVRATYSNITKYLVFIADRLGEFMVVGFDFDGKEFSPEFYEALAKLPELKNLIFLEASPV